jgi:hypothetical protein
MDENTQLSEDRLPVEVWGKRIRRYRLDQVEVWRARQGRAEGWR